MSSCLFECLKEAGLVRYYLALESRGYDTAFKLLYLPPAELQDIGITTDSDRQRFLQLVQIIASFHQGGDLSPEGVGSPRRNLVNQGISGATTHMTNSKAPCYQGSESGTSSEESPTGYTPSPRRRQHQEFIDTPCALSKKKNMPVPVLPIRHVRRPRDKHSDLRKNAHIQEAFVNEDIFQRDNIVLQPEQQLIPSPAHRPLPDLPIEDDSSDDVADNVRMSVESLKVQKIVRNDGYNYGLPRDEMTQNGARGSSPRLQRKAVGKKSISSDQNPRRRITVCVRKRPLLPAECQAGGFDIVTCNREDGGRDGGLVVHELKHAVDLAEFIQQNVFQFDKVFAQRATNRDVYDNAVKPMVDWIMTQSNRATCFGYGQTGAGKTHTLLGDSADRGVFFYAARDILSRLSGQQHGRTNHELVLAISLYEIYCSRIFDLLNGHKRLQALEDSNKQIHIHGLKSVVVQDMPALQEVMQQGLAIRSVGITGANQDSSRSHAIVQLSVRDARGAEFSRFSFIDLAGSERASDALRDSDKQNRLEGAEINQSLLALKECIRSIDLALAHTPFRQSKLTQVLRDSFMGNSKTCMIANISPSHSSLEHTMNTLRYASRVKELHRKPGFVRPRQQRNRPSRPQRRPVTSHPASQSKPSISNSPRVPISRSISIDSGTRVADYTAAFKGQGRELTRTPPLVSPGNGDASADVQNMEAVNVSAVAAERAPHFMEDRSTEQTTEVRNRPVHEAQAIFSPEVVAASASPSNEPSSRSKTSHSSVLKEILTSETRRSSNEAASARKVSCDADPEGSSLVGFSFIRNNPEQKFQSPSNCHENLYAGATATPAHAPSVGREIPSEHGSAGKKKPSPTSTADGSSGSSAADIASESEPNRGHRSSRSSVASNDSENKMSADEIPVVVTQGESTKNPGRPSPMKFLTHIKDKNGIRTKALKQQLRKARRRAKVNSLGSDDEAQSSDHSMSSSSAVTYSTSRDNLTSNVQQHHQQLGLRTDAASGACLPSDSAPTVVTGAPTPPQLPSPKLDRSLPRRSSRVSSRSASPGTGGRTTPDEKAAEAASVSNAATMKGLTSVSELRARLAAAAAALKSYSDSDDARMSGSEIPLPSTSRIKTLVTTSRTSSSSDKENTDARPNDGQSGRIQRAQSEVIIAHQEHISEILRISIEEERLYHELRDHWGEGTLFESYTKSLKKLLARKTQSIETLKVQLAVYDRICNAQTGVP